MSADGQLLTASSVESHKLNLEAQPEVGTQVESLFVLKHSTFTSESVDQLGYETSQEAIKSLLDWYRVFDIEADVDGVISEIKDINVSFRQNCNKISIHFYVFFNIAVKTTSCLICQRFI